MLFRRLEILSDRQNVAAGGQNIIHEDRDLLVCLSEADHESGLGQDRRILFLYIAQNAQRPLIARLRADGPLKLFDRLNIQIEHIRMRGDHDIGSLMAALHVARQRLDRRAGAQRADGADGLRKVLRAAVRQNVKPIARVCARDQPDILFGSEQAGLDSGRSEVVSDEILHTSPFIAPSKKRVSLSAIFVSSKAASPQKIRIRS